MCIIYTKALFVFTLIGKFKNVEPKSIAGINLQVLTDQQNK